MSSVVSTTNNANLINMVRVSETNERAIADTQSSVSTVISNIGTSTPSSTITEEEAEKSFIDLIVELGFSTDNDIDDGFEELPDIPTHLPQLDPHEIKYKKIAIAQ